MNSSGTGSMSKRQRLIQEVDGEIRSVADAIQQVTSIRSSLDDKVQKIKSEIRSNFSIHLNQIRCREEQLLRQVDVLTANQTSLLNSQVAQLYHIMGRLQSTLECVENDERSIVLKDIESVKRMQTQSIPSFALKLDNDIMLNTIQEFGRLEVLGTLLSFPPPEGSKCLPSRVEEYEADMDEYNLMHKTLQNMNSVINVQTPSKALQDVKRWIHGKEKIEYELDSLDSPKNSIRVNQWLQKQTPSVFDKNSKHLHKWLNQIRDADELEPDNLDGSQSVDLQSIATSESVEKIPTPECSSPFEVVSPFSFPQAPLRHWLKKASDDEDDCQCSEDKKLIKEDDVNWLSTSTGTKIDISKVDIKKACIANEICCSFENCLSDTNCALQWLQENKTCSIKTPNKNLKNLDVDAVIAPMLKILSGKTEDFLTKQGKEVKSVEKIYASKDSLFSSEDDSNNWLSGKGSSNEITKQMRNMFECYFQPIDLNIWLTV